MATTEVSRGKNGAYAVSKINQEFLIGKSVIYAVVSNAMSRV